MMSSKKKSGKGKTRKIRQQKVTFWVVVFVDENGMVTGVHPEGMTEAGAEGFAEAWNGRNAGKSGVGRVMAVARRQVVVVELAAVDGTSTN